MGYYKPDPDKVPTHAGAYPPPAPASACTGINGSHQRTCGVFTADWEGFLRCYCCGADITPTAILVWDDYGCACLPCSNQCKAGSGQWGSWKGPCRTHVGKVRAWKQGDDDSLGAMIAMAQMSNLKVAKLKLPRRWVITWPAHILVRMLKPMDNGTLLTGVTLVSPLSVASGDVMKLDTPLDCAVGALLAVTLDGKLVKAQSKAEKIIGVYVGNGEILMHGSCAVKGIDVTQPAHIIGSATQPNASVLHSVKNTPSLPAGWKVIAMSDPWLMRAFDLIGFDQQMPHELREYLEQHKPMEDWGDAGVLRLWLRGVGTAGYRVLIALEDPHDGLRSMLEEIYVVEEASLMSPTIANVFDPARVIPITSSTRQVWRLVDPRTGKHVVEIGTDYTDDEYPTCVLSVNPANLWINTPEGQAQHQVTLMLEQKAARTSRLITFEDD